MHRQRIPAELLGRGLFGEIQNAQDVPFQMSPAELRLAFLRSARLGDGEQHEARRHERP